MAAMMAPTIGVVMYSQASLKLPVATIGPSARAGLKAAPVSAPPMMMLRVSVIPIASGARLPARPEHDRDQEKGQHCLDQEAGSGRDRERGGAQSEVVRECRCAEAGLRASQHS